MRIGHGYDAHRLVEGRPLVLGGVTMPHETGLDGHSDADVLLHAVMDALLGASGQGDIGRHFPPGDPQYKDASSLALLRHVGVVLQRAGYMVCNIDATIVAEAPKLARHLPRMRDNIADALALDVYSVNVKATTEEGMGFSGRGEGMAAHAVCLLDKR